MSGPPPGDHNNILPRDNSMAPSLVLFDIDKERIANDNEDPSAPDKSDHPTSMNLLGNDTSANDVSLMNGTDNHLLGDIKLRSDQQAPEMAFGNLPARRNSEVERDRLPLPEKFVSPLMAQLKKVVDMDSPKALTQLVKGERIGDPEEALMVIYVAVVVMNTLGVFDHLLEKHQRFKTKPVWHLLFSMPNIFQVLQSSPSMAERQKFDELVLKVALERELNFIIDIVLDNRTIITPEILSLLLAED